MPVRVAAQKQNAYHTPRRFFGSCLVVSGASGWSTYCVVFSFALPGAFILLAYYCFVAPVPIPAAFDWYTYCFVVPVSLSGAWSTFFCGFCCAPWCVSDWSTTSWFLSRSLVLLIGLLSRGYFTAS